MGGCDAADAHVRAVVVVSPEPLRSEVLGLLDGFNDVLVEPFVPNGAVVSLDVGVLLRLAGMDVLDRDALFLSPDQQLATDVFRAVVDPYGAGFSALFNDPIKAPYHPFGWQREVDLDAQALAVEVIKHVQQSKRTAITEAICHEAHRPGHVGCLGHRQHIRFVPLQPLAGLGPQVQLQGAIDPIDAFMVPRMTGPWRAAIAANVWFLWKTQARADANSRWSRAAEGTGWSSRCRRQDRR